MPLRTSLSLRALLFPTIAALLSAAPLSADESLKPSVTLDREEALYQAGEEVTFQIEIPGKPATRYGQLDWRVTQDGGPVIRKHDERLKQGSTTATIAADKPGFLRLDADANPDKRLSKPTLLKSFVVAGVSPDQIRPASEAPEDFDVYWAAQKEFLAAVPPKAEVKEVPSPDESLAVFDVQVDCAGGKPVSGYYARPVGAAEKSLPAILILHSAGVRSSAKGTAVLWAKKNMLAFDVNAHGIANGQKKEFYEELAAGELKNYPLQGRDSRDSFYFNGVFLRILRAIDFLAAQPEWNGETLIAYGSSQGGAQAIVAAALDSRVTFYAAAVPALGDLSADQAGRAPGWPPGLVRGPQAAITRGVAAYYDIAHFAPRVKVPGILSVGFLDTVCPPSSVYAVYNVLGGEKQIVNGPAVGHSFDDKAQEQFNTAVTNHVSR